MISSAEKLKGKNVHGLADSEIDVEVIIPETLEEAIQDAGGEQELVNSYGDHKRNRALTAGRNQYRNAGEGTVLEDLIEKVKNTVKTFTLSGSGRDLGVKAKAQKLDDLKAQLAAGKTFTADELLAMLSK